jgi:CubicO group peptidase (beta-lactamase class C family)
MKKFLCGKAIILMLQAAYAQNDAVPDPPLRTDSFESVITDLEQFIPEQMAKDNVIGLSVAFIREGKIVWERGFGVTNSLTRTPVTPQTVFSAASLGKAVSAYLAMQMVSEGKLSLDAPLITQLKTPWLPRSNDHDAITLRHLLTHTSGLSNFLRDQKKNLKFKPGEQFSYSGVGFMYMQAALAQTSGKPLDEMAREHVFAPLKMASTYFDQPHRSVSSLASGHITFARAIAPFSIIFVLSVSILILMGVLLMRWRQKHWRLSQKMMLVSFLLSGAGTFYFLIVKAGGIILADYFTFCALLLLMAWLVLTLLGAKIFQRLLAPDEKRKRAVLAAKIGWGVASLAGLFLLLRDFPTPLPNWFERGGNAASSLRATASDLALFLIELMDAQHLSKEMMAQMQTPQVKVNEHISWGLGIGIQHSAHGESLWHWGSNPGSKSIMVVYPAQRIGIVVLCNSSEGSDLIFAIAKRALGGKAYWDW